MASTASQWHRHQMSHLQRNQRQSSDPNDFGKSFFHGSSFKHIDLLSLRFFSSNGMFFFGRGDDLHVHGRASSQICTSTMIPFMESPPPYHLSLTSHQWYTFEVFFKWWPFWTFNQSHRTRSLIRGDLHERDHHGQSVRSYFGLHLMAWH
jgi:hypothetical protein